MSAQNEKTRDSENTIKIMIVDDHEIVRQGLIHVINQESDLIVCAEAENADEALAIIEMEVKGGKCDPELFKVFVESEVFKTVL